LRRITESKWRVSLTTTQGQIIEKVVDAPDMADAIRRGQQAFSGQQFIQATANQLDPQLNIPTNQAAQQNILPRQLQGLRPLRQPGQRESLNPNAFNFPYSITLPAQFRKILHEVSPVSINESMGQYHIVLENQIEMKEFLDKLKIHRDRASVQIIINGIRSSIS
jgi:hypothetical protein